MQRDRSLNRRQLLVLAAGAAAGAAGSGALLRSAGAAAPRGLSGTPFPLVALDGKARLGQVYDHPPNYETPTTRLIGTRNPPFTDAEDYYVRYREGDVYRVDAEEFRLRVGGEAATEQLDLSLDDLRALPIERVGAVGACSGLGRGLVRPLVPGLPWTKGDLSCGEWTGVPLAAVLRLAGARADASVVAFRGGRTIATAKRDYWRHWALESTLRRQPLLAYELNGEPIPLWNGYPLRLVVPGTYAPGWVKQIVEIDIRHSPHPGDWRGTKPGTSKLKTMSMITDPPDGTRVRRGARITLRGVAWDHGPGIRRVELSTDGGRSWTDARLAKRHGRHVWRVFHASIVVPQPGQQWILTRATSADGETQPMDISPKVLADQVRQNNAVRTFAALLEVD